MNPVTGSGGSLSPGGIADELFDAAFDLVADRADFGGREAGGVVEFPVFVTLARVEGAGVAAAHGARRGTAH